MESDFLYCLKKNFLDSILIDIESDGNGRYVLVFDNDAKLIVEGIELIDD